MRIISLLSLLLTTSVIAQKSMNYNGEQLLIYPYEKNADLTTRNYDWASDREQHQKHKNDFRFELDRANSDEVFFPFGEIEDGKYLCFTKKFSDYSWEYLQKQKKAFKSLNHINQQLPYAIFHVKDGALNGWCYYLNPNGDTTSFGVYKDNLKEGKWYQSPNKVNFSTYQKGMLNGEKFNRFESFHKRKKFQYRMTTTRTFQDDVEMSYKITTAYQNSTITETKQLIDTINGKKQLYQKKMNDQLLESGMFINDERVGEHKWYYANGTLQAVLSFTGDTTYLANDFQKWANGIKSDKKRSELTLYGIKQNYAYKTDAGWSRVQRRYYGNSGNSIALANKGIYYFKDGTPHFKYVIQNGKFIPDTLYNPNGTPEYFVYKDERTKDFVKVYFDENGTLENVERTTQFKVNKKVKKYLIFNGEKLEWKDKTKMGSCYYFSEYPDLDSLDPDTDTLMFTEYYHDGRNLIGQVYFLPFENTRVEKRDVSDRFPYISRKVWEETRQYFDENYTQCKTEVVTEIGAKFKIYQSFDQKFSDNYYEQSEEKVPYNGLVKKKRRLNHYKGNSSNFFAATNYDYFVDDFHHPQIQISNYTSSYTYKNKPYSGKFVMDINRMNGSKLKINKRKIVFKSWRAYRSHDNENAIFTHDGFYAKKTYNNLEVLPDFWMEIPNYDYTLWTLTEKIKGQFENGKKSGKWVVTGPKKKLMKVNFKENHLDGEFTQYKYIPAVRRRSNYWYGTNKRVPAQYFDYMNGFAKEGQLQYFTIHNVTDSVIGAFNYENGQPKSAQFIRGYKATFLEGGCQKEQVYFVDGQHDQLNTQYKYDGKMVDYTYQFKDGFIDGPFVFKKDSGSFSNKQFTGKLVNGLGYDREKHERIVNGLLMEEYILNADQIRMTQMTYDTAVVKLNGSIYKLYDISNNIPVIPFRKDLSKPYSADVCGAFKSFYVNGQVHAKGKLCKSTISKKEGVWTYYNPNGEIMATASYFPLRDTSFNGTKHFLSGQITIYKNNQPSYEAYIIDLMSKYNCADADSYEVRQLWVTKDVKSGKLNPSRYQRIYYDMEVLQAEGEIVNGLPHGVWKFYNRDGGLESVGVYVNGKKDGRWLKGDLTGLGFIGDFCIAPNNYEFEKKALENDLELIIQNYNEGDLINQEKLGAYLNR